jgi:hypothetical protein
MAEYMQIWLLRLKCGLNLENSCSALLAFFIFEGESNGVGDVGETKESTFNFASMYSEAPKV